MKRLCIAVFVILFILSGCKDSTTVQKPVSVAGNSVRHAKGLQIYPYDGYTVIKVTNPWPGATESYTYVMLKKGGILPDSLKKYTTVPVPIKSVVVTSTTHIPSLEALGAENTLKGFPDTNLISSEKTRKLIDAGRVAEAGANEELNTEIMIDLNPEAVVGFSISSNNKSMNGLQSSGLKVLYNGDWTEQTPLGKAEWIKFFGALYDKEALADSIFRSVEEEYSKALQLAKNAAVSPSVLCGAIYNGYWYLPQGGSWGALFLRDAKSNYLWADTTGTGSLSLDFEAVLDKAQNADVWIGPSQFSSLKEMEAANPHYKEFKAFRDKKIYSYSTKKGATGGLLYFELAPNRPDLVLKDLISILHPELLPGHQLQFFDKLN